MFGLRVRSRLHHIAECSAKVSRRATHHFACLICSDDRQCCFRLNLDADYRSLSGVCINIRAGYAAVVADMISIATMIAAVNDTRRCHAPVRCAVRYAAAQRTRESTDLRPRLLSVDSVHNRGNPTL